MMGCFGLQQQCSTLDRLVTPDCVLVLQLGLLVLMGEW
jgi:hypothetical protein